MPLVVYLCMYARLSVWGEVYGVVYTIGVGLRVARSE